VRVCMTDSTPYSAAGGWARLADPGFAEPGPAGADFAEPVPAGADFAEAGAPPAPGTISECVLHVSGLVPHRPYYATCAGPAEIRRAVIAELADAVPGQ